MDQCSTARHPIGAAGTLTDRPGRALELEVDDRFGVTQRSPASGSVKQRPPNHDIPLKIALFTTH